MNEILLWAHSLHLTTAGHMQANDERSLSEPGCQQQRGVGIQTPSVYTVPHFQTVAHRKNFLSKHKGFWEGNCRMFPKCLLCQKLCVCQCVCVRSKTGLSLQRLSLHNQRNNPLYTQVNLHCFCWCFTLFDWSCMLSHVWKENTTNWTQAVIKLLNKNLIFNLIISFMF